MKAQIVDFSMSMNRKQRITLELEDDFRLTYDKLKDKPVDLSVKKWSEHRTLTANAYLWTLITQIGNAIRESKEDVYFDMLKAYGQGAAASVQEKDAERFCRSYKYNELIGESVLNGKTFKHYRFWVGSSEYNREEFTILLDGVVREAQNLGLETRPKEEIESLLKEFER